jgi:hypothetical protein
MVVQARKKDVLLLTPRRTFARIQPTKNQGAALGLWLEPLQPGGRLQPGRIHETMRFQIILARSDEIDAELMCWMQLAYAQNC